MLSLCCPINDGAGSYFNPPPSALFVLSWSYVYKDLIPQPHTLPHPLHNPRKNPIFWSDNYMRLLVKFLTISLLFPLSASYADTDRSRAEGHLSRSKGLLIAALREFDEAMKHMPENSSLNTARWRNSIAERAEEVERLISPKAREARGGIRYEAYPELLSESKR